MFNHSKIEKYEIDEIPLNDDIYLVDERWIQDYEANLLNVLAGGKYNVIGYVSFIAARSINEHSIDLTWYANIHDRWHEIPISLPKDQIVICVSCHDIDEKPRIFVKSGWLNHLYIKQYSMFCLIDAIYVKKALSEGRFGRNQLNNIQSQIDKLAQSNPSISFISFADSILLKSNWTIGAFDSNVKYTYSPLPLIDLANRIYNIYQNEAGLSTYAIFTQGTNEFHDDSVIHISPSQNHVSLNSLGGPFAKLLEIDHQVRNHIRAGIHKTFDFYLDEQYFHTLRFPYDFEKDSIPRHSYKSKFPPSPSFYRCLSRNFIELIPTI